MKRMLSLPQGNKSRASTQKEHFDLPEQVNMERVSSGISGVHDNISPTLRPLSLLSVCKNMKRSGVSASATRPGRNVLGDKIGDAFVLGLSVFHKSDGTKQLITGAGEEWKAYNEDNEEWDLIEDGLTTGERYSATTFHDLHIITNGADNVKKYDGDTVEDLEGSPPKGRIITTAYSRVFLAGIETSPHLFYASDIADAETWPDSEDPKDSVAVPVNDKDGDEITWIKLYQANVTIWKRHSLHTLHGPELGKEGDFWQIQSIAGVGTPAGRTVVDINGVLFWFSDSENARGIVRWRGGKVSLVTPDSPIKDILDGINYSAIDTACAVSDGEGQYLLAVPTGESTIPDTVIVYKTQDETWWVWDGWEPTAFSSYRGQQGVTLLGDADGYVYKISGTFDGST